MWRGREQRTTCDIDTPCTHTATKYDLQTAIACPPASCSGGHIWAGRSCCVEGGGGRRSLPTPTHTHYRPSCVCASIFPSINDACLHTEFLDTRVGEPRHVAWRRRRTPPRPSCRQIVHSCASTSAGMTANSSQSPANFQITRHNTYCDWRSLRGAPHTRQSSTSSTCVPCTAHSKKL